jgi:parallel beta-helix repeat protein
MKYSLVVLTAFALLTQNSLTAKPLTLFVATNGNDNWSGRLEKPAPDSRDGPFATLLAALKAARLTRPQAGPDIDVLTILLRGGTYHLAETVKLSPEDSGTDEKHPFTIAAYPGEKPVLSGGQRITGWKRVEGRPGLWQTEIPAVREGKWYFRSLFVNGERRQRARTPNEGFFRIEGDSPQDKPVKLHFKPGDIKKEWADAGDVEVIALLAWSNFRMFIRSVDEVERVATLSTNARPSNQENNPRYYVENAPDGVDAPGEWHLDRKTGVITYFAKPGEDLTKAAALAAQLQDLMVLQGDFSAKKPVRNVALRGLTFADTDWTTPADGYADTQAAVAVRGDLFAEGAVECVVEDCTFTRLAGYALEFGKGCQRNKIVGNEMFDLGAGGIRLGEPTRREDPFEQNHDNVIADNHIYDGGIVYPPAVGVLILQSGQNRVAHNHIHHLYYTAISVGWNWGYQETPCRENIIEFNHLHDIGQFMLSDMAGVYTLGIQKGTVIRNNLIHDVNSFTYGGWGLYPDEGSTDIVLENNVVYRCKSAGFHQHYGRENIVRNNIFAFGKEYQLMRTREESHVSFIFTNNIVYFDSGSLLGSSWKNDYFVMERNVYFDARPGATPETTEFAGATLEKWRARGHDVNSIIADPLFVAPEKYDFRLKTNSPALKLGFKPIDLSKVGVRSKKDRKND